MFFDRADTQGDSSSWGRRIDFARQPPGALLFKGGNEVKHSSKKWITLIMALSVVLMLGACKKKVAPPPPPPPPPPAAPTASLTANPSTIEKGQSTTLTWETQN